MDIKIIAEYMREKLESYDENEKFSIKEIAEKFGYTKYEFSRKFKKETGFSAKEFVSVLKLEKSLQKLIKEDKSVILAQLESGYESSGSFSNIFRKNTGLSSREYRKNIEKLHEIVNKYKENNITIPMLPLGRSLNLSNAVAIVLFEALRQNNFEY